MISCNRLYQLSFFIFSLCLPMTMQPVFADDVNSAFFGGSSSSSNVLPARNPVSVQSPDQFQQQVNSLSKQTSTEVSETTPIPPPMPSPAAQAPAQALPATPIVPQQMPTQQPVTTQPAPANASPAPAPTAPTAPTQTPANTVPPNTVPPSAPDTSVSNGSAAESLKVMKDAANKGGVGQKQAQPAGQSGAFSGFGTGAPANSNANTSGSSWNIHY